MASIGCWTVVEHLHVQSNLDGTASGAEEDSSAAFGFGMTILRDESEGRLFSTLRDDAAGG
jgi:hypothetical protein